MKIINIKNLFVYVLVIPLFGSVLLSCERDSFNNNKYGLCKFSEDTIMFDTIFSNIGTSTYKLVVKNENNYNLIFDSVYLAQNGSGFILNIDGTPASSAKRIIIDAKDSLYIFIQALIPEKSNTGSFLNADSIVFVSGNSISNVKLIAVTQNVISFRNVTINSQEWTKDKPYLIYGTLTLNKSQTLTIHEGTKVYLHKNANIKINGTLKILGTHQSPVFFRSDRLEKDYDSIPGQWGQIEITGTSEKHVIQNAIIRNGTTGLKLGDVTSSDIVKAEISNTIISNMGYSALISYQADVSMRNCLLANSVNTLCSIYGGSYEFIHCSMANYGFNSFISRSVNSKALIIQNFVDVITTEGNISTLDKNLNKAYFGNSIIYGSTSDEISLIKKGETLNYMFENCLLDISDKYTPSSNSQIVNCILNKSPRFLNPIKEIFKLDTLSPAKDHGKAELGQLIPLDLDEKSRINDAAPDIGVFERIEK
jgi:hypothetical protein